MTLSLLRTSLVPLCAAVLFALATGLAGCGMPWASNADSGTDQAVNQAVNRAVNQAVYRIQGALGLPDGAITRSSQPPLLADSDVALRWLGGRADVETNGQIRAILIDTTIGSTSSGTPTTGASGSGKPLYDAPLDDEADRLLRLLGWDDAALETAGFTPGQTKTVDYGGVGTMFQKMWIGHDPEGVLNEGVIEVGVSSTTGDLHSFLYRPGPQTSLAMTSILSEDQAIKAAKQALVRSSSQSSTSTTGGQSSATTTTGSRDGGTTSTTSPRVDQASLVHTDKAGITGGKDQLVWVVKVAGTASGGGRTTLYLDASNGKILLTISG